MRSGITTLCDGCFKPIDGIYGTAKVRKQYISIRGTLNVKTWDFGGIEHYVYAILGEEEAMRTWLNFCNGKCLDDFMVVKMLLKAQYHDSRGLSVINYTDPDTLPKKIDLKPEPKIVIPPPVPKDPEPPHEFFKNFKY